MKIMCYYKTWLKIFLLEVLIVVLAAMAAILYVDPFFHYRKPNKNFHYQLLSKYERYQNDGIIRHFDYNAIITGSSMTENFKSSEFDKLFKVKSIKVPFSGGYYKEITENMEKALSKKHDIKIVLRCLDLIYLVKDKDERGYKDYPTYLYNDSILDDIEYLFNKDALNLTYSALNNYTKRKAGITSFDDYANWNKNYKFGANIVLKNKFKFEKNVAQTSLSADKTRRIKLNIQQNVIEIAKRYPHTDFYYYFPPYSMVYWGKLYKWKEARQMIAAQEIAAQMMLECPNIKLFNFSGLRNTIVDLNNYKDDTHHHEKINSSILKMMKNKTLLLTKHNYKESFKQQQKLILNFDYDSLYKQVK